MSSAPQRSVRAQRPWFLGDGQTAALIASCDWSATPLGAIEDWPQSLKSAAAILLRSPVPMLVLWGEDGVMLYNDAYAQFAGGLHPELLGSKVGESCPEFADLHVEAMRGVLAGDSVVYRDRELTLHRHGRAEQVFVDLDYSPVVDERGQAAGVLAIVIERTARRRAERRLHESAERFRAFLAASTTSMYRMSPDWREMRQLDGRGFLSDTEAPNTDWLKIYIHPDDQPRVMAAIEEAIRGKRMFELEHRVRLADGSLGWTHSRAVPILDEQGEIVEWFGAASDVTERKRLEDALRADEERFRLLYEAQHTAHLVLAPDLTIEAASAPYLEATMTRAEDLIGRNLFEAFPDNPDDPTATGVRNLAASLNRVLEHRRPDRMAVQKYDIRRPTGEFEERWWAPINIPVFGPDGEVRNIIHQVEDVTAEMIERERAAEARAGEARFRELADAIPGLVFETDPEGRNTYVNRQYGAYTGRPFAELLGEGWQEVMHPDDRSRAVEGWREAVHSGRPFELECRIRRADGAWRWFMLRTRAIRDAQGRVEKGIGVGTDIDDARRAQEALRESEQQFRTMAESLPQLAWMADAKGWIYWYNRRWYEYTGTTLPEMEGWGWRRVHHPDHVDRVVERIQHAWDTGEPWEDIFPLRGVDGQYRWFLSRATPIRDAEARVTRWFGTNTDITEQQKREDLQRLLIREISHRVKNSLAMVSALLHLQARTLSGASRGALEDASSRVRAVATVHDQLWRQTDAGEIELAPFLSNLAGALAMTAPRHQTIVEVDPAIVSADVAVPIGLLVNELVTNAYKYAYVEGEEGEVRITGTRIADGRYRLEVADAGRGLPADFDLGRSRTSLGMRVVTSLATQLNGELTTDRAEPGARFIFTFPLEAPAPPARRGKGDAD